MPRKVFSSHSSTQRKLENVSMIRVLSTALAMTVIIPTVAGTNFIVDRSYTSSKSVVQRKVLVESDVVKWCNHSGWFPCFSRWKQVPLSETIFFKSDESSVVFRPPKTLRKEAITWKFKTSENRDTFWDLVFKQQTCGVCREDFADSQQCENDDLQCPRRCRPWTVKTFDGDEKVLLPNSTMVRIESCPRAKCWKTKVICTVCVQKYVNAGMDKCPFCMLIATPLQFTYVKDRKPFVPEQPVGDPAAARDAEYNNDLGLQAAQLLQEQEQAPLIGPDFAQHFGAPEQNWQMLPQFGDDLQEALRQSQAAALQRQSEADAELARGGGCPM